MEMKNILTLILIALMVGLLISVVSLRRDVKSLPEETARQIKDSADAENAKENAYRDSLFRVVDNIDRKDWNKINNYITNKYETKFNHIDNASYTDLDSFFTVKMAGVGEHCE
ncbi:MAG: hypothetical protein A2W93_14260 [Bacteroidetes bacterium GWF2_43_63]|nr:MAG: hypothetical protein A2W94_00830 [Bacteroidetes bacterium GWE2_42_42]OFY52504.1 MAG: hypothetical protein A2W93_14260 [Bacteroidetes bacterium GWF2_43_63]HBG71411.1 hypothetical protein [Bacteroidales bacterium]HCB60837.1 hypothetical protein [Bacteroidales bacterium]HCY23438.1 hypothetical protein [Bacteroidales bacterium]